ncbi:helix-turn-helix domain-containing protein [Streptomyces mirabilis]|uniref:helix-turn-helix domain-containing protein n=1 Tax=Streptomyces mirabilis TaxID=68239 RepID=UPI00365611F4
MLRLRALRGWAAPRSTTDPANTITSIAKLLAVSRTTIYKYLPECQIFTRALKGRAWR